MLGLACGSAATLADRGSPSYHLVVADSLEARSQAAIHAAWGATAPRVVKATRDLKRQPAQTPRPAPRGARAPIATRWRTLDSGSDSRRALGSSCRIPPACSDAGACRTSAACTGRPSCNPRRSRKWRERPCRRPRTRPRGSHSARAAARTRRTLAPGALRAGTAWGSRRRSSRSLRACCSELGTRAARSWRGSRPPRSLSAPRASARSSLLGVCSRLGSPPGHLNPAATGSARPAAHIRSPKAAVLPANKSALALTRRHGTAAAARKPAGRSAARMICSGRPCQPRVGGISNWLASRVQCGRNSGEGRLS